MDKVKSKKINECFNPSSPIEDPMRMVGREYEIGEFKKSLLSVGTQVIITGPRGIGKTSLINVVSSAMANESDTECRIHKCSQDDLYENIMFSFIDQTDLNEKTVKESQKSIDEIDGKVKALLFEGGVKNHSEKTIDSESILPKKITPQLISKYFKNKNYLLIIDEFDRIENQTTKNLIAETLRYFADYGSESNLVICGIDIALQNFFNLHLSNLRSTTVLSLNKLESIDLLKIIDFGASKIEIKFDEVVKRLIVWFSDGLPFFTHYLAKELSMNAMELGKKNITLDDLNDIVLNSTKIGILNSIESLYQRAVFEEPQGVGDPMRTYFMFDDETPGDVKLIKQQLVHCISFLEPLNYDNFYENLISLFESLNKEVKFKCDAHNVSQILNFISQESSIISKDLQGNYCFTDPFYKCYVRMKVFDDFLRKNKIEALKNHEVLKLQKKTLIGLKWGVTPL
jgi:AAA+ ATPase superfamily predicted ATPase